MICKLFFSPLLFSLSLPINIFIECGISTIFSTFSVIQYNTVFVD